jgi:hypothetical protein
MISLKSIQTEVDASYLYKVLSENEEDENVANVFLQMSEIEESHAIAFLRKNNLDISHLPNPSKRAKILHRVGRILGYDYILGVWFSGMRQVIFGLIAAAITFGIGHLIGVSVMG